MSNRLDELLKSMPPPSPTQSHALERARAASAAELAQRRPVRRWKTEAWRVVAVIWGLVAMVAVGGVAIGVASPGVVWSRLPLILAAAATAAVAVVAALSPKVGLLERAFGIGAAALMAVWLVWARAGVLPHSYFPEWVCTASHLAAGVIPLAVAWAALRNTAPNALRTVLVGLAAGTTGALIGEIACEQSARHVATYHLGAWIGITAVALIASRLLPRRAFAP